MKTLTIIAGVLLLIPPVTHGAEDVARHIQRLKSKDWREQRSAAAALEKLGPAAKDAVPALIQALKDKNWAVRSRAAEALEQVWPADKKAVPALTRALKDEIAWVRTRAAGALGRMGPEARQAVPQLIQATQDKDIEVAQRAVWALGRVGSAADDTVSALIRALGDTDRLELRRWAVNALVRIGPPALPQLVETLKTPLSYNRYRAPAALKTIPPICQALAKMGPAASEATPALIRLLGHSNWGVRYGAAEAIAAIGPANKQVALVLVRALRDDPENPYQQTVCLHAVAGLGRIGPVSEEVLPALIQALSDKRDRVRVHVTKALVQIGPPAVPALVQALPDKNVWVGKSILKILLEIGPPATPQLIAVLKGKDSRVRAAAAKALGQLGPAAKDAAPELTRTLKDQDDELRRSAAEALGRIGPAAKDAVPELIKILKGEDVKLRKTAAEALGRIGPAAENSVPELIKALKGADIKLRRTAARAIGGIGPAAKQAAATLTKALDDENKWVRRAAAEALGKMGPAAKQAVPALIEASNDNELLVRREAVEALAKVEPTAKQIIPHLIRALKDRDWVVPKKAEQALVEVGPPAVPGLTRALKDEDAHVRRGAANALGDIRPAPKQAVPALIQALKDGSLLVRTNAAKALGKFGAAAKEATPALVALIEDKTLRNRDSFWAALTALGEIGPAAEQAVPALLQILEDKGPRPLAEDWYVLTAITLWRIRPDARQALPALVRALQKSSSGTAQQQFLIEVISGIGPPAVPYLTEAAKGRDSRAYTPAVLALSRIDVSAKQALPTLVRRFKTGWFGHDGAAAALGEMGPAAADAVPVLIAALSNRFSKPRLLAAQALGRIGPPAAEAVGALKEVLKGNEEGPVGRAAGAALRAIGPVSDKTTRETCLVPPASTDFGLIKRLKLDRDQRWALDGWLGWQWPVVEPEALVRLLYSIVDEKQLGILKGMVASGAMPALPPARGRKASKKPADTLGRTDMDIFLEVHPDAKRITLKQAGAETYTVLYQPTSRYYERRYHAWLSHDLSVFGLSQDLAVFDKTGRVVYKRSIVNSSQGGYGSKEFRPPLSPAGLGCVLAVAKDSSGRWSGSTTLILVGFKGGKYNELKLAYSAGSSPMSLPRPSGYYHLTWVEDVDGDGTPEICRFEHHNDPRPDDMRLKCLRWDAAKGKWQWLEKLAGRRVARDQPPVKWLFDAAYDQKKRTVDVRIRVTSLTDKPLTLTQPLESLVRSSYVRYYNIAPDEVFPCPIILQAEWRNGGRTWRKLTPPTKLGKELKLAPGATASLRYRMEVPEQEKMQESFKIRLTGRARWGRFEANYTTRHDCPLARQRPQAEQQKADAEIKDPARKILKPPTRPDR